MRTLLILRQFLADLGAQRLRTALTVLGIAWGTVAVVVLLAFGTGLERQMKLNSRGLGEGIIILFGGRTTRAFEGFNEGRPIRMTEDDAVLLAREIPDIAAISGEYASRVPVRRGTAIASPFISGIEPVYGEMRNVIPEPGGRFINAIDVARRRRVIVLGDEIARLLFEDEDPVGGTVHVGDTPFLVVGVMKQKTQDSSYGSRDSDRVFIPISTHRAVLGNQFLSYIVFTPTDATRAEAVKKRVYETLGRRHRFDPADNSAVRMWDTTEQDRIFGYIFLGFNIFLGVVGSFTLTVGGIGVANIMYIVVRERTREIGVKRSIGARRRDIMLQFIAETFMIVGLGAAIGFLLSLAIVAGLGALPIEEYVGRATISPTVLAATLTLLGAIAFLAGLFPARRAANLDPVESLRY